MYFIPPRVNTTLVTAMIDIWIVRRWGGVAGSLIKGNCFLDLLPLDLHWPCKSEKMKVEGNYQSSGWIENIVRIENNVFDWTVINSQLGRFLGLQGCLLSFPLGPEGLVQPKGLEILLQKKKNKIRNNRLLLCRQEQSSNQILFYKVKTLPRLYDRCSTFNYPYSV